MSILSFFSRALFICLLFVQVSNAQVTVSYGPEINNNKDQRVSDFFGSDETSYYCHRLNSGGRNDDHFIEKYDKKTMKLVYSKAMATSDDNYISKLAVVEGKVYVFRQLFDKSAQKITTAVEIISSDGVLSAKAITIFETKSQYREVLFDVRKNKSKTKFLLQIIYQEQDRIAKPLFLLWDIKSQEVLWTKTTNVQLTSPSTFFILAFYKREKDNVGLANLLLDDNDNVYYTYIKKDYEMTKRTGFISFHTTLCILESNAKTATEIQMKNTGSDDRLYSNNKGELWYAYVSEDMNAKEHYSTLFMNTEKINVKNKAVSINVAEPFSQELLVKTEAIRRHEIYYFIYDIDESSDNLYYLVSQCKRTSPASVQENIYNNLSNIVFKIRPETCKVEWASVVNNRCGELSSYRREFEYFLTDKYLCVLHNDNVKNLEIVQNPNYNPKDLKFLGGINGSNLICSSVNLMNGKVKDDLVLKNDGFNFVPFKQVGRDIMFSMGVHDGNNQIITHLEKDGKSKFVKIKVE